MKKMKKFLIIFMMICAMFTFTQSVFAEATPITQWNVTYSPEIPNYYCDSLVSGHGGDYYANLYMTSSWNYCSGAISGTTYVSDINQLLIDWDYETWDSGSAEIDLYVGYDGGSEYIDLSGSSGTAAIDLRGYSGPVTITLEAYSYGYRRIDANIYISYQ
ncbi:hypothetical protein [Paenibacillus sp. H1-7]|uniref:hypothetical protein n=1 Tax=Paenibacillus sp. H1-7 TaxID=2282849 RepID=UPI001EF89526|nr:hypothetical protein [Paenibacillus sp. H1-7]